MVGFLGEDRVSRDRHLHRAAETHTRREAQQAAAGREQTDRHLGDTELGAPGGNQQVARQRELEPTGESKALNRTDERLLGTVLDERHHRPDVLAAGKGLEVHPCAEAATSAGEHTGGESRI